MELAKVVALGILIALDFVLLGTLLKMCMLSTETTNLKELLAHMRTSWRVRRLRRGEIVIVYPNRNGISGMFWRDCYCHAHAMIVSERYRKRHIILSNICTITPSGRMGSNWCDMLKCGDAIELNLNEFFVRYPDQEEIERIIEAKLST